jgi:predicted RNA-binding Zn-ribbon protein involved in translation (DUF1610 family)
MAEDDTPWLSPISTPLVTPCPVCGFDRLHVAAIPAPARQPWWRVRFERLPRARDYDCPTCGAR